LQTEKKGLWGALTVFHRHRHLMKPEMVPQEPREVFAYSCFAPKGRQHDYPRTKSWDNRQE
jgi:hypothetical protein